MTEEKKEKLKRLLEEAMTSLEIRSNIKNISQLTNMGQDEYKKYLEIFWKSYSHTQESILVLGSYEPYIASEETKSKLLNFIKEEFNEFIYEDRILSAGFILSGGPLVGYDLDRLLTQLLRIVLVNGIESAVSVFDKGTK